MSQVPSTMLDRKYCRFSHCQSPDVFRTVHLHEFPAPENVSAAPPQRTPYQLASMISLASWSNLINAESGC